MKMFSIPVHHVLVCIFIILCCFVNSSTARRAQNPRFGNHFSNIQPIVFKVVQNAVIQEARMAASILRLHFHDCFVHGCDGSVLLDGTDGEKFAFPNFNSLRGFEVIDQIKTALVNASYDVSCADILAIAASAAVEIAGGPSWPVSLGRKDSLQAYQALANTALPPGSANLSSIVASFAAVGLTDIKDVVVLSGGHTFGRARCFSFIQRLYNFSGTGSPDPTLDTNDLAALQSLCPQGGNLSTLSNLDVTTPDEFDAKYFTDLQRGYGLLQSDQELYNTPSGISPTAQLVQEYANNQEKFFHDFADSMVKMSNILPPAGSGGEIRLNCRVVNS